MASYEQFKNGYEANWKNLRIRPERAAEVRRVAQKLLGGRTRYLACEKRTGGIPWWFIGLCHYRESNFNFATYLGNGQALHRVTTIVPIGRGPFASFEEGAEDAMRQMHFVGMKDWSLARTAYRLEAFNGFGYHSRGVNSPYLYGGSNIYGPPENKGGKFPRDHYFDPNIVDTQLGTLTILKMLMTLDDSIKLGPLGSGQPATQGGVVVAGGGAVATAAAAGWPWSVIIALVIGTGLISFMVWHFMKRKPDVEQPPVDTVTVKGDVFFQDNKT